ncbi:MAG: hypothetical protein ACX94B_07975 [Henriciella sp.]|nr:hypothetical protein [Hyphomonadaceae bacterium]
MNSETLESCLDTIESVFEQEAEYIVRGQLSELNQIAQSKFEHLAILSNAIESGALKGQSDAVIRRISKLQSTAEEHGRHLQAMQHGLKRVLGRLDRLQSDVQVGSYDQSGTKVQFSGARGRFESKA